MKNTIHRENFKLFKKKFNKTYEKLSESMCEVLETKLLQNPSCIVAQELINNLCNRIEDFQFQVRLPENIFRSYCGMELYDQIKKLPDWIIEKSTLNGKDYMQTIYIRKGCN